MASGLECRIRGLQFGRSWRLVVGEVLRDFKAAVGVFEIRRDPCRPKTVVPDPSLNPGGARAALNHAVGVLLPHGILGERTAYAAPQPGHWGDAQRDSIAGPSQFSLDASMGRTFRLHDLYNLDIRVDSKNLLNHVTYTAWNTTMTSPQFGLPSAADAMRSLQLTVRLRY